MTKDEVLAKAKEVAETAMKAAVSRYVADVKCYLDSRSYEGKFVPDDEDFFRWLDGWNGQPANDEAKGES